MQTIPVTNDARQTFTTVLDGQEVRILLWYADAWYISLSYVGGVDIVNGARLNCSTPLMQSILTPFIGDIIPVPSASETSVLGRNAWGTTHILSYLTPQEVTDAGF